MGLSDGRIPASQITMSSVLRGDRVENGADLARLNGLSAWRPLSTQREYISVITFKKYNSFLFILHATPD